MPTITKSLNVYLGVNLRAIRLSRKQSLEDFAKKVGIGKTTLIQIEKGTYNITLCTLEIIAESLGMSPLDLLTPSESHGQFTTTMILFKSLETYTRLTAFEKQELANAIKKIAEMMEPVGNIFLG